MVRIRTIFKGGVILSGQLPKEILNLLQESKKSFERILRAYFDNYKLTITQINTIILLHEYGEMSLSDFSNKMGLSKSTVSGIIDRLEQLQIVKRKQSDTDRRKFMVGLTEEFKLTGRIIEDKFNQFIDEIFADASNSELEDIVAGLDTLNKIMRNNTKL